MAHSRNELNMILRVLEFHSREKELHNPIMISEIEAYNIRKLQAMKNQRKR